MNMFFKIPSFSAATLIILPSFTCDMRSETPIVNDTPQITYIKPYETSDNFISFEESDYLFYRQLLEFTNKLITESKPLEKEFSDLIDKNFGSLL